MDVANYLSTCSFWSPEHVMPPLLGRPHSLRVLDHGGSKPWRTGRASGFAIDSVIITVVRLTLYRGLGEAHHVSTASGPRAGAQLACLRKILRRAPCPRTRLRA